MIDYGAQLVDRLDKESSGITYGVGARADFRASNYHAEFSGTSYQLDARGKKLSRARSVDRPIQRRELHGGPRCSRAAWELTCAKRF